jgi:hypothetical protein
MIPVKAFQERPALGKRLGKQIPTVNHQAIEQHDLSWRFACEPLDAAGCWVQPGLQSVEREHVADGQYSSSSSVNSLQSTCRMTCTASGK